MSTMDQNDKFLQNLRSSKSHWKSEIFCLDMSGVEQNDNFEQNPGLGKFFGKSVRSGPKWHVLWKILDQAKFLKKSEIFCLDMSTLHQNDNFVKNLRCGKHFSKVKVSVWTCLQKNKMTILSGILPRVIFFGKKCPEWTKMTTLCKILDLAKVFGIS